MIFAVVRVMWLELWRDRGALVLAFVLPSLIFAIFASIFSGATDGQFSLNIALASSPAPASERYIEGLAAIEGLQVHRVGSSGDDLALEGQIEQVEERVANGAADVGLVVTADAGDPNALGFVLITEPSRKIAAASLEGALRRQLASEWPALLAARAAASAEALVGGFDEAQRRQLDAALAAMAAPPGEAPSPGDGLFSYRSVYAGGATAPAAAASIAYYAGATAILFLLLAAMQAGLIGLEERRTGIRERLLLGPSGRAQMVLGRFVFLTGLGALQALTIMVVAHLCFDLAVPPYPAALLAITLASAVASAGLALLLLSLCRSTQQANALSAFFVLIISAVGGSMVPRYMMPEWLQTAGLITPNAWAIDGFYGALARGSSVSEIAKHCTILVVGGLLCLALAALKPEKS